MTSLTTAVSVFRVISTCTSLMMLLSPVPSIIKVCKAKSTGIASIVPLVTMLANSHIVMMYGYLSTQYFPVFSTFAAGDVISLCYIVLFYYYTHERTKAHKAFLLFGIPVILITVYAFLGGYGTTGQSRHAAGQVVGYITIVSSSMLYASPMERVGHVLKHRSAAFLNIHMIVMGTTNNLVWIIYSSMIKQWILFAPNALSFVVGCAQITLYFAFHPKTHPLQAPEVFEIINSSQDGDEIDAELGKTSIMSTEEYKFAPESPVFLPLASPLTPLGHRHDTTRTSHTSHSTILPECRLEFEIEGV